MKQTHTQPLQTHFLGVLLNDDLRADIEESRRYMAGAFGCKSGHKTPLHVTLIPPFRLSEEFSTADIERALQNGVLPCACDLRFTARIDGYGSFAERTVFARVECSPKWTALRDAVFSALTAECPRCTKKDARAFTPHITVANRDIPAGAVQKALIVLNEKGLQAEFQADNVAIFERKNGLWEIASVLEF